MATFFEKIYNQLSTLQEDFNTIPEVENFFDTFLIEYVKAFNNAITMSVWDIIKVPYDIKIDTINTDKKISAKAEIQVTVKSKAAYDLDLDFDRSAPVRHKGWEEYEFKQDKSIIITNMIDWLTNFAAKGIDLSSKATRFPLVQVTIANIDYKFKPYAYKYDNSPNVVVSNFATALQAIFTLELSYTETIGAPSTTATTISSKQLPRIKVQVSPPVLATETPIGPKAALFDHDFIYDKLELTSEYKQAAAKSDNVLDIIKAIKVKKPNNTYDVICETGIGAFEYEDSTVYPANLLCNEPHFVTWVIEKPFYITHPLVSITALLSYWEQPNTAAKIPYNVVLEHVILFNVYIKETAQDIADLINKFASQIIAELPNPKTAFLPTTFTPTEKKLHEFLADVSWKAEFDSGIAMEGIGYEIYNNFRTKLISEKQRVTKFIIIGGEF